MKKKKKTHSHGVQATFAEGSYILASKMLSYVTLGLRGASSKIQ